MLSVIVCMPLTVAIVLCFAVMLQWFVSSAETERALNDGLLLEEDTVETMPERVPNCCVDENVNVHHIKKYFTADAWQLVQQVIEIKQGHDDSMWDCKVCNRGLHESSAIFCDCCLEWYHLQCTGLKHPPKRKEWFCRFCFGRDD